jgi:hypothetical protein
MEVTGRARQSPWRSRPLACAGDGGELVHRPGRLGVAPRFQVEPEPPHGLRKLRHGCFRRNHRRCCRRWWRSCSLLRPTSWGWVVQPSRRRLSSSCSGEQEAAAQQPSVDGGQHAAPVGLSLREGAGWFQPGECLSVGFGLGQPGSRGDGKGGVTSRSPISLGSPEPGTFLGVGSRRRWRRPAACVCCHGRKGGAGWWRPTPAHGCEGCEAVFRCCEGAVRRSLRAHICGLGQQVTLTG